LECKRRPAAGGDLGVAGLSRKSGGRSAQARAFCRICAQRVNRCGHSRDRVTGEGEADAVLPNKTGEFAVAGADEEDGATDGSNAVELAGKHGSLAAWAHGHEVKIAEGEGAGELGARLRRLEVQVGQVAAGGFGL
jgi:hypothetical protein